MSLNKNDHDGKRKNGPSVITDHNSALCMRTCTLLVYDISYNFIDWVENRVYMNSSRWNKKVKKLNILIYCKLLYFHVFKFVMVFASQVYRWNFKFTIFGKNSYQTCVKILTVFFIFTFLWHQRNKRTHSKIKSIYSICMFG